MTNEQVLEQQVEALEKLLQLKQAVIEELEAKVQKLQNPYGGQTFNVPNFPSVWPSQPYYNGNGLCTDGNPHTYPSAWQGMIGPPCCTKCGAQATSGSVTITPFSGAQGVGGLGTKLTRSSDICYTSSGQGFATNAQDRLSCSNASVIPLSTAMKR